MHQIYALDAFSQSPAHLDTLTISKPRGMLGLELQHLNLEVKLGFVTQNAI